MTCLQNKILALLFISCLLSQNHLLSPPVFHCFVNGKLQSIYKQNFTITFSIHTYTSLSLYICRHTQPAGPSIVKSVRRKCQMGAQRWLIFHSPALATTFLEGLRLGIDLYFLTLFLSGYTVWVSLPIFLDP